MRKYVIGFIVGILMTIGATAYADDIKGLVTKTDSIEISTNKGYIYPTEVEGKEYLSIASPNNLQLTSKKVWVNGKLEVNGWDYISNGDETLQSKIDDLEKRIAELESTN